MAKMFYTLDETIKRLGRTEGQVKQFAREGRLREFRDGPRLMFKSDQVIRLADELNPPIGSGSGVFDLPDMPGSGLLALSSDDSGSGFLDMIADPDDTFLGSVLDEITPPIETKSRLEPLGKKPIPPHGYTKLMNDDLPPVSHWIKEKHQRKSDWQPRQSFAKRLIKTAIIFGAGVGVGFVVCLVCLG